MSSHSCASSMPPCRAIVIAVVFAILACLTDASKSTTSPPSSSSNEYHDFSSNVAAVACIAMGAVLCFAGYRTLRLALFFCGFVFGGAASKTMVESICKPATDTPGVIGFAIGGLLLGLLAMWLYSVGIFFIGAAGGVMLAYAISTVCAHKIYAEHPTMVLLALAIVLGLVGGAIAVVLERPIVITATAYVGAVILIYGIGFFAGNFPNEANLKRYRRETIGETISESIPTAWWIYYVSILVCFGLGVGMQFHTTSKEPKARNPREDAYNNESTSRYEAKMAKGPNMV